MNKRFCFYVLTLLAALFPLQAQNVIKVVTTAGKTVKYSPDEVSRIEFYPDGSGNAGTDRDYSVSPAEGVVDKLDEFVFVFSDCSDVAISNNGIAFLYVDGTAQAIDYMRPSVAGNVVTVNLTTPIEDGGVYTVVIPAGILTLTAASGGETRTNDEVRATYQIEGGAQLPPMVGDFYYSDGTWSTSLVKKPGVEPIGVVFYVGVNTGAGDNAAYYTSKEGNSMRNDFHGYVLSLTDATLDADGNNKAVAWSFFSGADPGCGCSVSETDFKGYTNTDAIKSRANKDYGGLADKTANFPATYYACVKYENDVPAPEQSSGWFLPSAGQLDYIMTAAYYLANGMSESTPHVQKSLATLEANGYKVNYMDRNGTRYWTSNEQYDSSGNSYRALRARTGLDFSGGFAIEWANKDAGSTYVRSILAF